MSKKSTSWKIRIRQMFEATTKILRYTTDMDEDKFYESSMVIEAVERNFQVLGEASKHVPAEIQEKYPEVPWKLIRQMRNFVIHQYDDVEEHILWDTIQNNLPRLKTTLEKLLEYIKDE